MGKKSEYAKIFGGEGKKLKVKPPKHHDIFMNDISKKKKKKKKKKNANDKVEKALGKMFKDESKRSELEDLLNLIPITIPEDADEIHSLKDLSERYAGLFLLELLLDTSGENPDKGFIMVTVTEDGNILDANTGLDIAYALATHYFPGDTESISETDMDIIKNDICAGNIVETVYQFDLGKLIDGIQLFTN